MASMAASLYRARARGVTQDEMYSMIERSTAPGSHARRVEASIVNLIFSAPPPDNNDLEVYVGANRLQTQVRGTCLSAER